MQIDFVLSAQVLGYDVSGRCRRLDPYNFYDDPRGLSGTEVNILGLAHTLAGRGHRIRVLTCLTQEATGLLESHLDFVQIERLEQDTAPIVVVVHDEEVLSQYTSALEERAVVAYHQT